MNSKQTQPASTKSKLNWTMVLFFTITPAIAIIGTVLLGLSHMIVWPTVVLAIFYICATAMTITGGYHRLFSHKAYKANFFVKLLFMIFGASAAQGSAIEWASDHRNHHRYTDTVKDPYNIKQGFWYAHIGWIFFIDRSKRNFDNVTDLFEDKMIALQHKHYSLFMIFTGFIMPMLIACAWGDPLGGLIIAGGLRMSIQHHLTWCINSVCHYFGDQTYDDSTARDNWFTALFTFGEGYHNFHHKFPIDYRNGVRFYHFDPTKWMIRGLSYLGMATELKRVPTQKIIEYKMRMQKIRIEAKVANCEKVLEQLSSYVEPAYKSVVEILHKVDALEKKYSEYLQNKKTGKTIDKNSTSLLRRSRRLARKELRQALTVWKEMLRQSSSVVATAA